MYDRIKIRIEEAGILSILAGHLPERRRYEQVLVCCRDLLNFRKKSPKDFPSIQPDRMLSYVYNCRRPDLIFQKRMYRSIAMKKITSA